MHYHFTNQKPVVCNALAALCNITPVYATLEDADHYRGSEPPTETLDFDSQKWWKPYRLKDTGALLFWIAFTLACIVEVIQAIATGTFWSR